MFPPADHTLSEAAEEAGIPRNILAKMARLGKVSALDLQN
jgi:hypothetical protein